eukprot:g71288.t1
MGLESKETKAFKKGQGYFVLGKNLPVNWKMNDSICQYMHISLMPVKTLTSCIHSVLLTHKCHEQNKELELRGTYANREFKHSPRKNKHCRILSGTRQKQDDQLQPVFAFSDTSSVSV